MITTTSTALTCIPCGTLRSRSDFCRHFMAAAKAMRHRLQAFTPATSSKKRLATTGGLSTLSAADCSTGLAGSSGPSLPDVNFHNRKRGTPWHEIVLPPSEVDILGLLVLPDVTLPQGTPRFYEFRLDLETRPKGKSQPPEVRVDTPCRDPPGKWDW